MDTFARRIAVDLTGRTKWSEGKGPAGFSGRDHIDLLADMLFKPRKMFDQELIPIDRKKLKSELGLDPDQRFFAPADLMLNDQLHQFSSVLQGKMQRDPKYRPSTDERTVMDAQNQITAMSAFIAGKPLAIVPAEGSDTFSAVVVGGSDSGHNSNAVDQALLAMQTAYLNNGDMNPSVDRLITALNSEIQHTQSVQSKVAMELLYNEHNPWRKAAIATVLALLLLTARWITRSKYMTILLGLAILWALAEQTFGLWLRVSILDRAPVSNTYEALLWMGIVAVIIGVIGQLLQPKSWYLAAGLTASVLSILFAMLVPLADQTNSLPAVLRSNYWLVVHVLTIVASYGALLLAAVLAHVYLFKEVFLRKPSEQSNRIIVQIYRVMQIGVILLTAGTILGGVWAADSWGRFWGWDPKETWSLISIIVYFALLHARYVKWIQDFGLAVSAIVGFLAIVWTFYGVNYVMASGLHSYGFGSGGERWVAIWAIAEIIFIAICFSHKERSLMNKNRSKSTTNKASFTGVPMHSE